ncbi:MAG: aminotransferase class V-fold PLP-dependent enzyme [Litorimonas sp.]
MREHFHVPDNYFLSHSVGCLPNTVQDALTQSYLAPWRSGANWEDWMPMVEQFRAGIASLLGVVPGAICPQTNISSALTKIIHALPRDTSRNVIVLSKQDFPTIGFVVKLAERAGFRVHFIDGDPTNLTVWQAAIHGRVAIVHVTHALSDSSHLLPVADICAIAKNAGAVSIVDIAQSFCAVPTPVSEWDPDFVLGTGVKFFCAGPGACFLYAKPERWSQCKPVDVGWFSHENPFEMDIMNFRYAADAMRFFGGTPSPAPLICANAAITMWQALDQSIVQAKIQSHLNQLMESAPAHWRVSPTDPTRRGATFVVKPDKLNRLAQTLVEHSVFHDQRKTGFRFSVHAYTPDDDIELLADILSQHRV